MESKIYVKKELQEEERNQLNVAFPVILFKFIYYIQLYFTFVTKLLQKKNKLNQFNSLFQGKVVAEWDRERQHHNETLNKVKDDRRPNDLIVILRLEGQVEQQLAEIKAYRKQIEETETKKSVRAVSANDNAFLWISQLPQNLDW